MRFLLLFAFLLLPVIAYASPEVGKPAPEFSATAIDGSTVTLSSLKGKTVVLEWHNPLCPFIKKHYNTDNMQTLQKYAVKQGVVWLTINSSADGKEGNMNAQQAKEYEKEFKAGSSHYLLDADGKVGKAYKAKTTPHMFVIDKDGNIAYMGAIDDNSSPDKEAVKTAHNYVRAAIDSLTKGKPPEVTSTQPYGCNVKYDSMFGW